MLWIRRGGKCGFLRAIFVFRWLLCGFLQELCSERVWVESCWHWFSQGEVEHLFGGEAFWKVIFIENVADDANALREGGGALAEEWVGHGGRRKMRPQEVPYVWCPLSAKFPRYFVRHVMSWDFTVSVTALPTKYFAECSIGMQNPLWTASCTPCKIIWPQQCRRSVSCGHQLPFWEPVACRDQNFCSA